MRGALLFLAAVTAFSFPQPASAQSLDCRYPRVPADSLICRDPRLSQLDVRMASLFLRVRDDLGRRGARDLEEDQERWLQRWLRCGSNYECIEHAYQRRIDELRDYRRR